MGIAYEEDIRKAREVLLQVLMEEPGILKDEDMRVFVDSLADSAVLLNVRGWAEKDAFWETKWHLAENVKYALDDAGIRIPFPQMDVHLDRK